MCLQGEKQGRQRAGHNSNSPGLWNDLEKHKKIRQAKLLTVHSYLSVCVGRPGTPVAQFRVGIKKKNTQAHTDGERHTLTHSTELLGMKKKPSAAGVDQPTRNEWKSTSIKYR